MAKASEREKEKRIDGKEERGSGGIGEGDRGDRGKGNFTRNSKEMNKQTLKDWTLMKKKEVRIYG